MISFGSGVSTVSSDWAQFKTTAKKKNLSVQFEEGDGSYFIYGFDSLVAFTAQIWTGLVPDGVAQTYSQAQNDADKADFETNFKPFANKTQTPAGVSKVVNAALKNGSSSNMAVNGSVTPQVFVYSTPNNFSAEVSVLSLLLETNNSVAFGNKFVDNTIATLTNGLLLEIKSDDVEFTLQNCKRTRDLVELTEGGKFDIVLGTPNFFRVQLWLPSKLKLCRQGTHPTDDFIRATVRDNLSGLQFMEIFLQGVKL